MGVSHVTAVLNRMTEYFGEDVTRINHALKVFGFSQVLSNDLDENEREILLLAAVLHDIGIKNAVLKHNSNAGEFQELEGPPIAREILKNEGVPEEIIDRVCFLIGHHHQYDKIEGEDYQILVEADFLVNIFEGSMQHDAIVSIRKKIFKTAIGIKLITGLYGL